MRRHRLVAATCLGGLLALAAALTPTPAARAQPSAPPAPSTTSRATTSSSSSTSSTVQIGGTTTTEAPRPEPAYVAAPEGARQTAAAYAYTWAERTNPAFALSYRGKITVPVDNPDERGRAIDTSNGLELDCTNFMSQALRVSGFAYVRAWRYDAKRRTATTAWVRASGPQSLTATFVKLGRMRLLNPGGAGPDDPPPPGVELGDILAWDLDGKRALHLDHQLMVTEITGTGTSWADIRVSYHTYDHQNRAMDEYRAFATPDSPRNRIYVFHVLYPS